ncbi:hypothetical protein ACPA0O_18555, partial [Ectopseudomonas chengduensis]
VLIVANAWAIDSPNCAELRHPRYESVFTHSGPTAASHDRQLSAKSGHLVPLNQWLSNSMVAAD